jgi:AcrR family transcriptional regulator
MSHTESSWKPSLAYEQAMGEYEAPRPRVTPAEAFTAARDHYRRGDRLDMVALAAELGVARATLYRWTGDRDQLLADVITAEVLSLAASTAGASKGEGVRLIEDVVGRFVETVAGADEMQAFITNEGEGGLRLLTALRGPIRPRIVGALQALIEQERDAGRYRPPASPELLADGIVSLGERYLHNGGDPTLNPDPATARRIVALLLREEPAAEAP